MQTIRINDISAPELDIYTKLSEVQLLRYYEPDIGVFVAESANVVLRALEAGYELISLLVEDQRIEKEAAPVFDYLKNNFSFEYLSNVRIYTASHDTVKDLTGYALVRGLWAVFRRKPLEGLEDFCRNKNKIALLYDIMNPTNAGAIIRSAAALGIDGVILTSCSVNPLSRRSSRVSMGTVFQIPWTMADNRNNAGLSVLESLHSLGFKTAAMALKDNSVSISDEKLKKEEKLAVILGTEGEGLPEDIIAASSYTVKIPMFHGVDSLNVAAASAVAFWELLN